MSGGVDSSVAAALLCAEGYEVIGLTMCFNLPEPETGRPVCCGATAIDDAKRVAGTLNIPHYVLGFGDELQKKVIDNFFGEYARGRTPNPCIRCNELLKFDSLLRKSQAAGAEFLATGHYARIIGRPDNLYLAKAKDAKKDQSYFLYRLNREQMRRVMFPLGDYTKEEVRRIAGDIGLGVAEKPDSQEICFIPGREALDRLRREAPGNRPGDIVDNAGNIIGRHDGLALFTIGQRRGMAVAAENPLYVIRLDYENNVVVAGPREEAFAREFFVNDTVFPAGFPAKAKSYNVKMRYIYNEAAAEVWPAGDELRVVFETPQFAIAPGQSAVFYDGVVVAGGGVIDRVSAR